MHNLFVILDSRLSISVSISISEQAFCQVIEEIERKMPDIAKRSAKKRCHVQ